MNAPLGTTIRVASAVAAAVVTAGILFGIPVLLWMLTEPIVKRGFPPGSSAVDLLLRPDDGTLLMGFLALVAACTWVVLAVSIVMEMAAALTRRPARRIDLPGFRFGRGIAVALVTAMVGAGPAVAAPATSASVAVLATVTPDRAAFSDSARPAQPEPEGPEHVVAHRDTLWHIAEMALGDPLRWREIYDLNTGRVQADGGRLTEAPELIVGWRLLLPSDACHTVRVKLGDTLTELAAEYLGDPARADDLFAVNVSEPQPGGNALVDPDLLMPGWTLTLPTQEDRPHIPPPRDAPVLEDSVPLERGTVPSPAVPAPKTTQAPEVRVTNPPAPSSAPPTGDGPAASTPAPSTGTNQSGEERPVLTIAALGVSTLVAGGVLTSLALRRRRQLRHRPLRHLVAVPSDEDGQVEWSLTHPDTHGGPTSSTRHLDLALRSLAHPDRDTLSGAAAPVLISARLTASDSLLTTAPGTELPAPFVAVGDQGEWVLDVDDALPVPVGEAAGCCAPFPTLVSIATDDDRTLMIDIEQRGVLRIGGDPARCVALLRHLAAELATSRTAEDTEILLVGLSDELPALNPDQLVVVRDLDAALTEIEHRASTTRAALERWQLGSVVEGRLRDVATDSWIPAVLISAQEPDDDQRDRLEALAAISSGTSAVAVVVIDQTEVELRIGGDGLLDLLDISDGPWQVAQLTENAGTHLAAILGSTTAPPVSVDAASVAEPWGAGMNEDGTLTTAGPSGAGAPSDDDAPDDGREPADHSGTSDEVGADGIAGIPLPRPSEHSRPSVEREAVRRLVIVDHQDPHLDDDLAAWHDAGAPRRPMIAILGEPSVRAPGPTPPTQPSWFAEVLVYLSLHPAGVTSAKAVTDLWPDGHKISPATLRHAFYGARKWAGRGLRGDPDAPFVSDMQNDNTYRLRGHLLDWDLFRRLRKRGQARHGAGHPDAVIDYEAALALVRSPVLNALRPGGYAWLNNHDQRHDLQIPGFIVDTAHELVDIALDAGNTGLARRAAERARMVDIDVAFDRPLTDLMRIAHAEDNRSELELYAAVLLDARGFDVPEELAPDSFTVLNDLLPAGPRQPRP